MLNSMTGFAALSGNAPHHSWAWEIRGVNGKGLDLRLRMPDWIEGLEPEIRARLSKRIARGNVTVSLRVRALPEAGRAQLDPERVAEVIEALGRVSEIAQARGVTLETARASDILALRGVFEETGDEVDVTGLRQKLLEAFDEVAADFCAARTREGAALADVLTGQLAQIETLVARATREAEARGPQAEEQFRAALSRVSHVAEVAVDEGRIAQELALLAMRADVTEELDRLKTHCGAARDLLNGGSPLGRKLDFLSQEFNREANTLCSKSQNSALTATGLELKSMIEQMREQVQNVE